MGLNFSKYYFLLMFSLIVSAASKAQPNYPGGALVYIDFGQSPSDRITVAGQPLPGGSTQFQYSDNICPPEGMYSVVNGAPQACDDSSLIPLFADNTPLPDNNGNMLILNDVSHSTPKILFQQTISPCPFVDYQFSAALINLDKPNTLGCVRFSSFRLEVRDGAGVLLGSTTTGDMQFAINSFGYKFNKPFVNFRLSAANPLPVTVMIIDEAKAISPCHNFIGIDDIKVAVTGITTDIQFDDTPQGYGWWVKSVCFQDNKSFTMIGTVESNIDNPAVQWEQSTDDGSTWRDIPGATNYVLTQSFPVADTFLFRMRVAENGLISSFGCSITTTVLKVQVDGVPPLHFAVSNAPVCSGDEIKFNAEGGSTYEWHGPNGFYDNIKFPTIYRSALKDSGWYYSTIKSFGGCVITDSTYVSVVGSDVKAWPDTVICAGQSVTLNTNTAAHYTWLPATGLSNSNIQNPIATPVQTTEYTVVTGDALGCAGKGKVIVQVKNKIPVAAAINALNYICRSADSILFVRSGTGVINNWIWDFGNGTISTSKQPPVQHYANIPIETNSILVRLIVTDTAGCMAEATHSMKVENMCNMAVPSAFTPNGDGVNDYFWPLNAFKAANITFTVFNRKGIKVFETKQWPDKWDGRFKGEPQDAGTYVWVFAYIDTTGKKQLLKGTVVLLR